MNLRKSKQGSVRDLKLCILLTGSFILFYFVCFCFVYFLLSLIFFFFSQLICFMPRGLFVFPGLFVVHLDLNQFLRRLQSKN